MEKSSMQSNLESFLDCTTPLVASQFLAKSEIRNLNRLWQPKEREEIEYFTLADLWNCFDEWSAYGAGVPIRLESGETLVQYYVPYLSAIQIFTSSSSLRVYRKQSLYLYEVGVRSVETSTGEETESAWETSDSLSDESESEKLSRSDGCSSEEGLFEQDNHLQMKNRLGYLYYQYFERSSPYGRVPLVDKISSLAERYPGLMSLRSVDLSPASWMSVAWYPIYHIPMGRTIKDLSTCFLTFHTLSSSFQDMDLEDNTEKGIRKRNKGEAIPLPPFGLGTYKMQGNVWISDRSGRDQERMVSLLSVADSWLKQLGVQHHDFNYFLGIRHG